MRVDEKSGRLSADRSILWRMKKRLWAGERRQIPPRPVVSEKREEERNRVLSDLTWRDVQGVPRRVSEKLSLEGGGKHVRGRPNEEWRPLQGKQGTRKISLEVRKTGGGKETHEKVRLG